MALTQPEKSAGTKSEFALGPKCQKDCITNYTHEGGGKNLLLILIIINQLWKRVGLEGE